MPPAFSRHLDLLRVLAALTVLLSHFAYPRFSRGDWLWVRELNLGSDAVVLFFVLSGLVISWTAAEKDRGFGAYAFARLTRLWSVVLPALVLTLVFDAVGARIDRANYVPPWLVEAPAWEVLARGLSFSTEWTGSGFRPGSNGPFWSISYEAAYYLVFGLLALALDGRRGLDLRQWDARLAQAAVNAGKQVAMIGAIIICASIIIGVLGITGLGVKLTSMILSGSGGALWPALLLTAAACLLLGMEVPTTAAYVICVSVAGPALIELGLEPLQAHLFVFWFALLSTITPPVCGAVFIAAGMIGENWLRVAGTAMALGIGLYLIPLGMIANDQLIALGDRPLAALWAALRVALGLSLISYGLIGGRAMLWRAPLIAAGLAVVFINLWI